jgi:uncharacterized cupin superfamily protein
MDRPSVVVNEEKLPWDEQSHGPLTAFKRKQLGAAANGSKLGCSLYELAPGKKAWPYHFHTANEEAIYVLEGAGTLRLGGREVPIAKGDYVSIKGGPEGAHQVVNTSEGRLRYLCFSTMIEPEVSVYPDSRKVSVMAGSAPGGSKEKRTVHHAFPIAMSVDYWHGEE